MNDNDTLSLKDLQDDLIDIRDIINRFEYLEGVEVRSEDEQVEMKELNILLDEVRGLGDRHRWIGDGYEWRGRWYPFTLIRDSYFEEAIRADLENLYNLSLTGVPCYVSIDIDYGAARSGYSSVVIDGTTYWYQ